HSRSLCRLSFLFALNSVWQRRRLLRRSSVYMIFLGRLEWGFGVRAGLQERHGWMVARLFRLRCQLRFLLSLLVALCSHWLLPTFVHNQTCGSRCANHQAEHQDAPQMTPRRRPDWSFSRLCSEALARLRRQSLNDSAWPL